MAGEAISKSFPPNPTQESNPPIIKKKRNQPGNPDPQAEVIALSPKTLLATNRFVCEICGKGFQRDQNLQLHRRGHNLPWKLRQRSTKEPRKRVYVCPEKTCIHHHPSRALGDLTGIKKHFCRKHGEKKWKCDKCSKRYAVQSDWKAHSKTCGTREYRCDCGTIFSRRDSFITHRAFCDALAEETARVSAASNISSLTSNSNANYQFTSGLMRSNMVQHFPAMFNPAAAEGQVGDHATPGLPLWMHHGEVLSTDSSLSSMHQTGPVSIETLHGDLFASCSNGGHQLNRQLSWIYGNDLASSSSGELITSTSSLIPTSLKEADLVSVPSWFSTRHHQQHSMPASGMSATALLQKAAQIGVTSSSPSFFGGVEMKRHNTHVQDGSEYNGLLNPSHPGVAANMAGSLESTANPYNNMYSTRHQLAQKDGGGGATRDFLGVGVQTICPSSVNGWI